jgi:LmbE family N-acetylglucosaminyl deacetylase
MINYFRNYKVHNTRKAATSASLKRLYGMAIDAIAISTHYLNMRESKLLGKKLLFLTAHPDDETYLAAGTIYKNAKSGGESYVVSASAGEQGSSHLEYEVTVAELKRIRKKELLAVSECVCAKGVHILNFPDADLPKYKIDLREKFDSFIKKYKPELVVTFGPDGVSGHLDHIAVGKAAVHAAKKNKVPVACFSPSPTFLKKSKAWMLSRRKRGRYIELAMPLKHNVIIKVDPKHKLRCFDCHQSQRPLEKMPAAARKQILNYEYFRV